MEKPTLRELIVAIIWVIVCTLSPIVLFILLQWFDAVTIDTALFIAIIFSAGIGAKLITNISRNWKS